MCGIAGFYKISVNKSQQAPILRRMLTQIKHRGPDQSGIYLDHTVGLGNVQLNLVDRSTDVLPISNNDGSLWIVFNGEIFNRTQLQEELLEKGYMIKTNSDAEVLISLYDKYGPEFVHKLNGQFSIAIWDKYKQELFLARDRVGIRPLYYVNVGETFVFASEIKCFLEFPNVALKISPKAISEYFTFWSSLSPNTAFDGVYEVPPGTYMVVKDDSQTRTKYWELPLVSPEGYKHTHIDQAAKEFESLFLDAVKLRFRSDVQVGAYLSGGLDSSVIAAFIKRISTKNLQTFSVGFTEKDYDESEFQNIATNYFKTEHSDITCSPNEIADSFKWVVWHSEAPLLRTAPAPMGLLAKSVRDQGVKVVISGEGADELLGGYNIYKEAKIRRFWAKDPQSKYRPLLLKKLYPYLPQIGKANNNVLKMFFGYKLNETDSSIYSHVLRWNNTSRINNYLSKNYKDVIGDYDPIKKIEAQLDEKFHGLDPLVKAQWIESNIFMSGYLLSSQGDRMTMTHSIEGRYPFLDHRVIEFCMALHPDLKLNGLNEKYLLKKLMQDRLPEAILDRPKQAYRAPIRSAFAANTLPAYLQDMLSHAAIERMGIFNPDHVGRLLTKMRSNKPVSEINNMAITAILSTQILNDLFVNRSFPKLTDQELIDFDKIIFDY